MFYILFIISWDLEMPNTESLLSNYLLTNESMLLFWESIETKEIKPVHPKGDQSWLYIGRTDAEAENPILWPPDVKNWLIGKDPDAGKDWRQQEKKWMIENKMTG